MLSVMGLLRLGLKPPFRRDLAALPALRAWLAVATLVLLVVGAWMLLRFPALVQLSAVAALIVMALLWWRARPSYGRSRGWPPGSLGIGASLDAVDNRDYYREQAARHGPIFKMSQFGRPVLCVVGLSRGRQLLQDHKAALAGASLPYNRFVRNGMLRYMTREFHQVEGPLFRRAFSNVALGANERSVRDACQRALASLGHPPLAEAGHDIRPLVRVWTIESLATAFFGFRPDDPRVRVLNQAIAAMNIDRSGGSAWRMAMQTAISSATDVMKEGGRELLARGDATSVLGVMVAEAPDSVENEGRLQNLFFMYRLAVGDLAGALTWVAWQLSTHTEWQARVAAAGRTDGSPRGAQPSDLATRVVLETLRLEQSEFLYRRVVKPIDFEGFHIPAGWILRICIQESHRDAETFADPATFNPDRFLGQAYAKSEYATFGLDEHACIGASMVLFFGRILAEEMCAAYIVRTTTESPFERGTRHRHHWRPGREWRVALEPRTTGTPA